MATTLHKWQPKYAPMLDSYREVDVKRSQEHTYFPAITNWLWLVQCPNGSHSVLWCCYYLAVQRSDTEAWGAPRFFLPLETDCGQFTVCSDIVTTLLYRGLSRTHIFPALGDWLWPVHCPYGTQSVPWWCYYLTGIMFIVLCSSWEGLICSSF